VNSNQRPIRFMAGTTFSIYLFHYPIMVAIASTWPDAKDSWGYRLLLIGGTFSAAFLLAQATERRKDIWARIFSTLLKRATHPPAAV
jgi:peptidoglycan/LPS O-acetylase OafA/YrhL